MNLGYNLTPAEEEKLNAVGDKLACKFKMSFDGATSPDSQGRHRWKTTEGTKTGIGLLRTIERLISEEVAAVVVPPGSKVVKNLLSGKECIIPSDTPLCCDPSSETYHSM